MDSHPCELELSKSYIIYGYCIILQSGTFWLWLKKVHNSFNHLSKNDQIYLENWYLYKCGLISDLLFS